MQSLIGADILQFFPSFALHPCMNGSCFKFENKIIPFGNVEHFLFRDQLRNFHKENKLTVNSTEINSTLVNLVLNPVKSYFSPLENTLTDSEVDNGLDNIFKLESIGINVENEDLTAYDKMKVKKFEDDILLKNNKYYVNLPWHEDKVENVSSNYRIAIKVLDKDIKYIMILN